MAESRTKNSIKNYLFASLGQFINLLTRFVIRSIFIYTLGNEYLGLNGLFSSVLQVLNLAELGVGVAITYSLYKPIAENDEVLILKIMALFKKTYYSIGIFVIVVGLALTPFLPHLINDIPNIPNIPLIYILYVIDTAIPYFFSYKAIFVTARQQNYIVTNNQFFFKILCTIAQCVFLLITKDYILFMIIQIFFTTVSNIRIFIIADKKYPFLKNPVIGYLDKNIKKEISNNISSTFLHKIGGVVVYSTDSILLSKFFGLVIVGLYLNYQLIINAVYTVINQFFQAVMASIGNLGATENKNKQYDVYKQILFINFWMYSFSMVALACLLKPFISIWLGEDYVMETIIVFFIVLNFYLNGMREGTITFLNAYGLVPKYKYMPIYESIINLVSSIILAKIIGPAGIFIGTTISTLTTCFWIEPKILFKYGFDRNVLSFYKEYVIYGLVSILALVITMLSLINLGNGLLMFVIKVIIVGIIPNVIIILFFHKTKEFEYLKSLVLRMVKR